MANTTIWRLVLIDNFDQNKERCYLDCSNLPDAIDYFLSYKADTHEGAPKYTVLGPFPISNFTF